MAEFLVSMGNDLLRLLLKKSRRLQLSQQQGVIQAVSEWVDDKAMDRAEPRRSGDLGQEISDE